MCQGSPATPHALTTTMNGYRLSSNSCGSVVAFTFMHSYALSMVAAPFVNGRKEAFSRHGTFRSLIDIQRASTFWTGSTRLGLQALHAAAAGSCMGPVRECEAPAAVKKSLGTLGFKEQQLAAFLSNMLHTLSVVRWIHLGIEHPDGMPRLY